MPNGWAPLQHMIIEGLSKSKSPYAKQMAKDLALKWIRTNYVAFKKTGAMHEKYDVLECGKTGSGGEYIPQVYRALIECNSFSDISLHVF